jgi:hypothetical protein
METMNLKLAAEMIRSGNKNTGLLDAALNSDNPVSLALAILDQVGYSAVVTAKIAALLEVE